MNRKAAEPGKSDCLQKQHKNPVYKLKMATIPILKFGELKRETFKPQNIILIVVQVCQHHLGLCVLLLEEHFI